MKTTLSLVAVAVFAASSLPGVAQDTSKGAGSATDTPAVEEASPTNADTTMKSDPAHMPDTSYEAAVIAIETSSMVEFDLVDAADITVLRLSELEGDAATGNISLDEALAASAEARSALHTSVGENDVLVDKLETEGGFAPEDVVAVQAKDDGSLLVYVDDRKG